jgi:hypothetical protein
LGHLICDSAIGQLSFQCQFSARVNAFNAGSARAVLYVAQRGNADHNKPTFQLSIDTQIGAREIAE